MRHDVDDGLGRRRIFVNGQSINRVVSADEDRGFVEYHPEPLQIDRVKGEVVKRTIHGVVKVEFIDEQSMP